MKLRFIPIFLGVLVAFATGCQGTCDNACSKIIETCNGGIPSYSVEQCTLDCNAVQTQYEAQDYLKPQLEAFQAQLDCIHDAECEDLTNTDAPACYNDDLFVF